MFHYSLYFSQLTVNKQLTRTKLYMCNYVVNMIVQGATKEEYGVIAPSVI